MLLTQAYTCTTHAGEPLEFRGKRLRLATAPSRAPPTTLFGREQEGKRTRGTKRETERQRETETETETERQEREQREQEKALVASPGRPLQDLRMAGVPKYEKYKGAAFDARTGGCEPSSPEYHRRAGPSTPSPRFSWQSSRGCRYQSRTFALAPARPNCPNFALEASSLQGFVSSAAPTPHVGHPVTHPRPMYR